MTPEERKEYNKTYYINNKKTILDKACKKVECHYCKRQVIQNNLLNHYETTICARKREQLRRDYFISIGITTPEQIKQYYDDICNKVYY